ncbi:MAG TPA: family 20 glycosylhydrolase [Caulobacteraceae bacterium]|nr:family 20 glycosylhydrolase [Caulobacteraceae bacterium]
MPRAALALILALTALASAARAQTLDITPRPLSAEPVAGAPVTIANGARITTPAGDASAAWTARYLASLARRSRGLHLSPDRGAATIVMVRGGEPSLGAEGYSLDVRAHHVTITAPTDAGLFYGAVSFWRMLTADGGHGAATLAPVKIVDRPRLAWRGLLLDSARHFQSVAFVEHLIDRMALLKLNTLQWHLTDDQGWRLQILRYPRLTSVGAWRAAIDPATGRPTRYGGFYTQAQVRQIVAYAAQRHVTIVPEIDVPGHSLSAIVPYPELGSAPPDPATRGDWGVFPSILDPSDHTLAFMRNVLGEVAALFPGPWINVGGDEAVKDQWVHSPTVQAQIHRLGLKDEEALQGWFTDQLGVFLATKGKRLIGWDDILKGGGSLPANAAVVSWHLEGAALALAQGRDAVIATDPTLYFDHVQAADPSEPPGRGGVVSLQDVYRYDPAPPSLPAEQRAHIIGVQANLWTEHMPTEHDTELMAFPRADAVAEIGWTAPARQDWADFARRQGADLARDRALGFADDMPAAPRVDPAHPTRLASQQLALCTQKVALNLYAPRDAQRGQRYLVDIMNPCWIYPQADLGHGAALRVTVTRLPFNFQLGADAAKIVLQLPTTPAGELLVREDGCAGPAVATVPLARAARSDGVTELATRLPALAGRHDLCLSFTERRLDPMWVVGWAEVAP